MAEDCIPTCLLYGTTVYHDQDGSCSQLAQDEVYFQCKTKKWTLAEDLDLTSEIVVMDEENEEVIEVGVRVQSQMIAEYLVELHNEHLEEQAKLNTIGWEG